MSLPSGPLFLRELRDNDAAIRELRGRPPRHFCYPSGVFRPDMAPALREMRIRSATTCQFGFWSAATDPLLVPRLVDTMLVSEEVFRGWISGTANLLLPPTLIGAEPLEPTPRREGSQPQLQPASVHDNRPRTPSHPSRTMMGTMASAARGSAHHQPKIACSATPASAMANR